jgi:hypothetical protein
MRRRPCITLCRFGGKGPLNDSGVSGLPPTDCQNVPGESINALAMADVRSSAAGGAVSAWLIANRFSNLGRGQGKQPE